ncbi:HAD family hydrolase [Bacillus sp. B1-b2]|uniref:HAD family hydrolase n=1 Tax=Bacillus sp. B1-b2 TaxID=2653201 RepID=UPI0012624FE6|nr:HAD family hydrolase [Bacillus sp. B1-b2]KAB7671248.1 HAD family hydrolase [Bacillus sp. B1-b2]
MIKAVIFDFDGLILDTETAWYESYKEALQTYQCELPLEYFVKCVGTDNTELHHYFQEQLGERCNIEDIESRAKNIHIDKMKKPIAREGVKDYLEEAQKYGYKIALASSSDRKWITDFLNKLSLIHYFEVIVTGDDVERVKPAPDLYLEAINQLNLQANEAVAFEDSLNGLQAATSAGLKCVIVPNPVTENLPFETHQLRLPSMSEKRLNDVIQYIEQDGV